MSKSLTLEYFKTIAECRNHSVLNMTDYKNVHSKIAIFCHTCDSAFKTTGQSYKNAKKSGCPECKKLIISSTHKGKVTSDATKKLIGLKASKRVGSLSGIFGKEHPAWKGGYGRDFKSPSHEDYVWKNGVRTLYNGKCALTGKHKNLVCHHLNGWNATPDQRFAIANGVLLEASVHSDFHIRYKFGNNTEEQFIDYCKLYYDIDWFKIKRLFINNSLGSL